MSAMNPFEYYSDEENHGSYQYVSLLDMVNNFIDNQTGDGSLIGQVPRRKIIYQVKQAIKEFNTGNLNEPKGCELEMNDTLTIPYPYDFVSLCTVSFVNKTTGELMSMSVNPKLNTFPSWLQDQNADILFDQDGYILEGTSMNAQLESEQNKISYSFDDNCCLELDTYRNNNYRLDATINRNGYYNPTKDGIHFSSEALSKIIMITYISDGLESNDDANIKINKILEESVYAYVKWNILTNSGGTQEYIVKRAEKEYFAKRKNATIKIMQIRYNDLFFLLNGRKNWLK